MDADTLIRVLSLFLNVIQSVALAYISAKYHTVLGGKKDE